MKRLTISDCGKFKLPPPAGTKERECPSYMDLYQRLDAYEDTGLEPEEIKAALEGAQREFEEYDEMAPKGRLRELAQADRERHAKHYRWMAPVCVGCPGKTEEGECNGVLRIPGQRGALY